MMTLRKSCGNPSNNDIVQPSDKMLAISKPDRSCFRSVTAGTSGVRTLGQLR